MKVSVQKNKKGDFQKKLKELVDFGKQSVEVGHFASQGTHKASGISYVDLMKMHEVGGVTSSGGAYPARPVKGHMLMTELSEGMRSAKVREAFKLWESGTLDNEGFFTKVGMTLVEFEKAIFGAAGPLAPNPPSYAAKKGGSNPLIDTGELVDAVSHKTSITGIVK